MAAQRLAAAIVDSSAARSLTAAAPTTRAIGCFVRHRSLRSAATLKLRDLVDLEWLLADPAHLPESVVREARPAALAATDGLRGALAFDAKARVAVCDAVLSAARSHDLALPGRTVERALRIAGVALVALGLISGGGAAAGFLAYDGTHPVNVLNFVLFFFGLQLVLLALMLWFVRPRRADDAPDVPVVHRAVAWFVLRLLGTRGPAAAERLHVWSARHQLYAGVERWTLFALVQRFGIAFNVAALVVTLLLVTGTDLMFSWSTTLSIGGREVHALTSALAVPWSFWDAGVPSLATVDGSQWMRQPPAGFVDQNLSMAAHREHAAAWWRFLVAGIVAYGWLPRTAALGFGVVKKERALRAVGLDHAGFQALYDRLLPANVGFDGPDPTTVRGPAPVAADPKPATARAPREPGAKTVLLCWGSAGRSRAAFPSALARRWSLDVVASANAGGADLGDDERALQHVTRSAPRRVVVVFPPGQQPTTDAVGFLRAIRKRLGPTKPLVVTLAAAAGDGSLTGAEPGEHDIWRRSLAAVGDAYLWLEPIEGP